MNSQKGLAALTLILIFLGIAVALGGGFGVRYYLRDKKIAPAPESNSALQQSSSSPPVIPTLSSQVDAYSKITFPLDNENQSPEQKIAAYQNFKYEYGDTNVPLAVLTIFPTQYPGEILDQLSFSYRLYDTNGDWLSRIVGGNYEYIKTTGDFTNFRLELEDGRVFDKFKQSDARPWQGIYFSNLNLDLFGKKSVRALIRADLVKTSTLNRPYLFAVDDAAISSRDNYRYTGSTTVAYAPSILLDPAVHAAQKTIRIADISNYNNGGQSKGWQIESDQTIWANVLNAPPDAHIAVTLDAFRRPGRILLQKDVPIFEQKIPVHVPAKQCLADEKCIIAEEERYDIRLILYVGTADDLLCSLGLIQCKASSPTFKIINETRSVPPVRLYKQPGGGVDFQALSIKSDVPDAGKANWVLFSYKFINNGPGVFDGQDLWVYLYNKTGNLYSNSRYELGGGGGYDLIKAGKIMESSLGTDPKWSFKCSPEGTENIIEVVVDPENKVAETNEANNTASTTILCTRKN